MGSNLVKVLKKFLGVLFAIAEIAITTASIISSFKVASALFSAGAVPGFFLGGGHHYRMA